MIDLFLKKLKLKETLKSAYRRHLITKDGIVKERESFCEASEFSPVPRRNYLSGWILLSR